MPLPKGDRVQTTGKPPESLPLSPEDFFVLSRVDGRATVSEVIASSGLDSATAEKILGRLRDLGAISFGPSPRKPAVTPTELKASAKQRRARMLAAQMKQAKGGNGASSRNGASTGSSTSSSTSTSSGRSPGAGGSKASPQPESARPLLERVTPVPADDPRVVASLDIPLDRQRRLLAAQDQIANYTHFDVLGLDPTDDKKLLRRAYFQVSRDFHPDTYYGKKIGDFQAILDMLFKRAKASYDLLQNDEKRTAYAQRILAQRRAEQEARARKEAEVRRKEQLAEAEEEARRSEEERRQREVEALQRSVAAKEREARDRERRKRMGRRLAGGDNRGKKAKEHFDQGMVELEAGRDGAAASLFRLAVDLAPGVTEYQEQYEQALARARADRARRAFASGNHYMETGRLGDAARMYADAARAEPNAFNLSLAAKTNADENPAEAHEYALGAIERIGAMLASGAVEDKAAAEVYLDCARAFQALGQRASAVAQVRRAEKLVGTTAAVRALLNSLKVT